jgi:bud site selection protein 31
MASNKERSNRRKNRTPAGFEVLEETLEALHAKMREAEEADGEGKHRNATMWPIMRIHHQKSRYVYDMYYKQKKISKEVYDYCINKKIVDKNLIAKWKKPGFDRLCCLRCIQTKDKQFGNACVCRVPKKTREQGEVIECVSCGCHGCA